MTDRRFYLLLTLPVLALAAGEVFYAVVGITEFGSGSVRVRISGFGVRYGSALYKSRNLRTTGTSLMNHMPPAAIGSDQTVRKQYLSNVGKVCFPVCANADFLRLAVPIFQRQPCRARTL